MKPEREPAAALALAQGATFAATGLWPLVSLRTFEAVTGRKTDHWLVQTVGLLLAVSGGQLLLASRDPVVAASPETRWLAMGTAAALAAIDVYYAGRRVIGKVYLLDALLEGGFVAAWWLSGKNTRRRE